MLFFLPEKSESELPCKKVISQQRYDPPTLFLFLFFNNIDNCTNLCIIVYNNTKTIEISHGGIVNVGIIEKKQSVGR